MAESIERCCNCRWAEPRELVRTDRVWGTGCMQVEPIEYDGFICHANPKSVEVQETNYCRHWEKK